MPERAYLSIGEVLALLKDEFTDITISKIRFLESQGLIDPERTPSGYRKFYEPDVERLRWILRQQKEHYLPLRVIKGKLSEAPAGDEGDDEAAAVADDGGPGARRDEITDEDDDEDEAAGKAVPAPPALAAVPDPPAEAADANGARRPALEPVGGERLREVPSEPERAPPEPERAARAVRERRFEAAPSEPPPPPAAAPPAAPAPPPDPEPTPASAAPEAEEPQPSRRRPAPPFPESLRRSTRSSPAGFLTAPEAPAAPAQRAPARPSPAPPARATGPGDDDLDLDDGEIELTADELAAASGLPSMAVSELERYGLVKGQRGPGGRYYDAAALEVARLAADFARFGVEARHLRMWKTAADREADFYEQVVTPIRSQRSSKARRQAGDTVAELADLGARLHAALVAGAMKRLR